MKKRSFILIAIFTILLALSVITASAKTVDSGTCGSKIYWTLDDTGSLVISGKGAMAFPSSGSPWTNNDSIVTVRISNGVTSIGKSAFSGCTGIAGITIPDSVTSIGDYAFDGCESLTSVTIGDGVTSIGDDAFHNCTGLTSVHIAHIAAWCNIAFDDYDSNPLYYAKNLYLDGELVTNLIVPNGVASIGNYAFSCCTGLIRVTIPDSVTLIGEYAFSDCTGLAGVTIPDSVTAVGKSAFSGCTGLTSVTIPESVTSIGDDAFYGCESLTSMTIPDSVTAIGARTFSDCESLTSVTIPDSVTSIGIRAFSRCTGLTSVHITDIAAWCNIVFDGDDSNPLCYAHNLYLNGNLVTDLVIPNGVASIGNYAFYGCESLTSVTIPDSVTSIGESAFSYCESLASVSVGSGITLIPESAFYDCSNLQYVCLPAELLYIRNDAFNECSNIETVFFAGSEAQWNSILFYNRNENLTNAQIVYNAAKKTYRFVTNCDSALDAVTDYAIFAMPTVKNDGMTLAGWYDNAALSGDLVTFPYYGSSTTLYAAWTDRTGNTFDDALIAKADQQYTVTTTTSGQYVYFEFVPKISKMYNFYSIGSKDTYGYLYDSNQSRLTYNDDGDDGINFYISYNLTAGETYYLAVKLRSGTGTFAVFFEEPVDYRLNEIFIKDMSGNILAEIPQDDFLATVSFTNVSSNEDVVIVLAQYTEAGAFRGLLYIQSEDIPTGSTLKLSIPVENSKGNIARLKAFCLASFESMVPIGNAASFPMQ